MSRPLRSWPLWLIKAIVAYGRPRALWSDAYLELHHREVVEPAMAAANDESGPWLVAPIGGEQ